MSLRDLFKSKEDKQQDAALEQNRSLLSALLYMAICDDKLEQYEFNLIQEVMLKKGISREQTAEEVKRMLKEGDTMALKKPESDQEKKEFIYYLATMMLMDHKIDPKELDFITMVTEMVFDVDKSTARAIVLQACNQLLADGQLYLEK
jgi:uncharacterized tellurite resistance protein B-like protein